MQTAPEHSIASNRQVPAHISRAMLMRIREAQRVQDRERVLRQQHEQSLDTLQFYPGPEMMTVMIFAAALALLIALWFQVVSVSVIYCPAVIIDSITIIVLRQISTLSFRSYWRRFCLIWCCINAHIILALTVVPVIDLGFSMAYRFQETDSTRSEGMRSKDYIFRYYLGGDVCMVMLATGCTVYAILTCFLCYATRSPIYTSYAVIDLSKLDKQ